MDMNAQEAAARIDHTLLKADAPLEAVGRLCEEALRYGFASVCIHPCYVSFAAEKLMGSGVPVGTVVGFPLGGNETAVKSFEAARAVARGALEVDMVVHVGALKSGNWEDVVLDVEAVVAAAKRENPSAVAKVIIETCLLTDEEIDRACALLPETGADYVKTSTGFSSGGATAAVVERIRRNVGNKMKIKAAGGIRTRLDMLTMIAAGADRIGTSNGVCIVEEFKDALNDI